MAKYVPITDYDDSAPVYNRAGMLYWRAQSEGKWYSSPRKPTTTIIQISRASRWSNDIHRG